MVSETEATDNHIEEGGCPVEAKGKAIRAVDEPPSVKRVFVVGEMRLPMDYRIFPFMLLTFTHMMILVESRLPKYVVKSFEDKPRLEYRLLLAYSLVGMGFSLLAIFRILVNNKFGQGVNPDASSTNGTVLAIVLFAVDYVAANYYTYNAYFFENINPFFALWFGVYGSVVALDLSAEPMNEPVTGIDSVKGLLVASLTHGASVCYRLFSENAGNNWYSEQYETEQYVSLGVAIFTLIAASNGIESQQTKKHAGKTFSLLAVCWIVLTSYVTVRGPFNVTADVPYYSAWFSFYFSVMAAAEWIVTKDHTSHVVMSPEQPPPEEHFEEDSTMNEMEA